jgi:hypothetical protein
MMKRLELGNNSGSAFLVSFLLLYRRIVLLGVFFLDFMPML